MQQTNGCIDPLSVRLLSGLNVHNSPCQTLQEYRWKSNVTCHPSVLSDTPSHHPTEQCIDTCHPSVLSDTPSHHPTEQCIDTCHPSVLSDTPSHHPAEQCIDTCHPSVLSDTPSHHPAEQCIDTCHPSVLSDTPSHHPAEQCIDTRSQYKVVLDIYGNTFHVIKICSVYVALND